MLLHEKRSWTSPADDTLHQTKMELRDAIFKKVLDGLARQDGVVADIVINRDGMVIEFQADGLEDRVDMVPTLQQMLNDAEKSLHRMGASPLRQMLIWTTEYLISVIPLDKEGILASILEPADPAIPIRRGWSRLGISLPRYFCKPRRRVAWRTSSKGSIGRPACRPA